MAITGFAGVVGPMLACFSFTNPSSALGGLGLPLPFTLAGSLFVLVPAFYTFRYILGWPPLIALTGVLASGTIAGWLALGAPSNALFGVPGGLGAWFGGFTALAWILGYCIMANDKDRIGPRGYSSD